MKILEIRREKKFNRGYVEIAFDGEVYSFSFYYDDYMFHNNPNPSPYPQPSNTHGVGVSSIQSQAPTEEEIQKHFYETAKWEISSFLATKIFKEWDVLKDLKK